MSDTVLVIGGGIAGIQASLDLADAGAKVTLVEREPTIGGTMAVLDKICEEYEKEYLGGKKNYA